MGMSSSKATNKPVYESQILDAAGVAKNAFTSNQAGNQQIASQVQGLIPGLIEKYQAGDPTLDAARKYSTDVLEGDYLGEGNPYLEQMISKTNDSVKNGVQASMGTRGQAYGSGYGGILSRALAENETGLRFNDYNTERSRMDQHAGLATQYGSAEDAPVNTILNASQVGAEIPYAGSNAYVRNIGGLLGQYQVQKQKQPWGPIVGGLLGSGLSAYASGGLK